MGSAYVDDHRFSLYQGGQWRDITAWVGSPEARDKLEALSVELTFSVLRNQLYDAGMPWPGVRPGSKLRVDNHGREVFSGVVQTVGLDGSVTANDRGWYLTKSKILLQVSNAAADDAIRRMCAKAGIPVGEIPRLPTRLSEVWTGDAPETILQDILKICSAETGKQYKRRVKLAKGTVSGSDSMGELRNSVVLVGGGQTEVLGRGYNQASIDEYGLVQTVERLSGDENSAQARQRIRTLLDQNDRLTIERQVEEIWGADEVESGVLLRFQSNRFGVTGDQRVVGVTHRYGPTHLMSLTVQDPAQGRAADAKDTVEV